MYKSYVPYLQHILDECLYVRSVIKDDMQREEFLRDETLKRAVTRSLSIIGEATKKIPADVKYAWQSILWREMQVCEINSSMTIWESTTISSGM